MWHQGERERMSKRHELPELDDDELALLAAFVEEERPPAVVVRRVRARVLESTVPAPSESVIRGPWTPWVAVGLIAAAAAALLAFNFGGTDATAVSRPSAQQAVDTPEGSHSNGEAIFEEHALPSTHRSPPSVEIADPAAASEAPAVSAPETPPAAKPTRATAKSRRHTPTAPTPVASESSLAAETRLLDRARRAVADGHPDEALRILSEAQTQFPRGVLGQERAALRAIALCDAGKIDLGRRAAAAFAKAHPRSALRTRVESACPADPQP